MIESVERERNSERKKEIEIINSNVTKYFYIDILYCIERERKREKGALKGGLSYCK